MSWFFPFHKALPLLETLNFIDQLFGSIRVIAKNGVAIATRQLWNAFHNRPLTVGTPVSERPSYRDPVLLSFGCTTGSDECRCRDSRSLLRILLYSGFGTKCGAPHFVQLLLNRLKSRDRPEACEDTE